VRLVVIGGVAAGLSAAARARRLDPGLEIIVLEKGGTVSYGACGLPYFIEGRVPRAEQLVVYTPEYFRKERNIAVRTGAQVTAIRHSRREVQLADAGERVHYDRLVIATGARPAEAPRQEHEFTLHTLDDAQRLKRFLVEGRPKRAAVIGAGYIGLEAADALRRNGLAVAIYERDANILQRGDAGLTATVRKHLERFHIELHTGWTAAAPTADLVLLANGIRPNVELAAEAGVECGRTGAIRVDEQMQTNLAGVFAAGDCAETRNLITGCPAYVPLGTTANKMGRVAGANAAGVRERFPGILGTVIVSVCGLAIAHTGLSAPQARAAGFDPVAARVDSLDRPRYFAGKPIAVELVADRTSGRLLGGAITGEEGVAGRINVVAASLQNRMRVDDFESLDLCYAPPFAPVWDPLLIAAQQLRKAISAGSGG
jgi:NADPH-dependent 2,4-dienoyl-CoA reductase/sulfur reductase-like enzyme